MGSKFENWIFSCYILINLSQILPLVIGYQANITNLSQVRSENSGDVSSAHLVVMLMLHDICHQIDRPPKQRRLGRR